MKKEKEFAYVTVTYKHEPNWWDMTDKFIQEQEANEKAWQATRELLEKVK